MERDVPVTADELHAYVDGLLPPDRRAAVEAWLAVHPNDAADVAQWRAQADAIRTRYGAVAIGATAGWIAHGVSAAPQSGFEQFSAEALNAHRLYSAEVRHPIEVGAGESHLLPWLSRRVGANLRAPNLEAYSLKLLGGRLLPGPNGPAALFMYETPAGERYTFYCSRANAPRTALRYNAAGDAAAVLWVDSEIGYVVSGPAERERLIEIAQSAYREMETRLPRRSTENGTRSFGANL